MPLRDHPLRLSHLASSAEGRIRRLITAALALALAAAQGAQPAPASAPAGEKLSPAEIEGEAHLFTAPGFNRVGEPRWDGDPAWSSRGRTAQVEIVVRDAATGQRTPCRINVVGRDGNFYQPPPNRLSPYALTSSYPVPGAWGNRLGKAPYRYVGRFFYTTGEATVRVPAGALRVEVWKGLEYRPETVSVEVSGGERKQVEIQLTRAAPMAEAGYHAGDIHLHFARESEEDDQIVFDLLEAEDFRYGVPTAYNHPAGPYAGFMDRLVYPQRALGRASLRSRGNYHIVSGQEYRNRVYGHLNLVLRDDLVLPGKDIDADTWPVHGEVGRETMARGGFAFMAHGGYRQEIYAAAALGGVNAVELLQFGLYRELGLEGWYDMLNTGYRFAAFGASDYPPCRTLADCRTYVYQATAPTMPEWLAGVAAGRSFFTTGPLLLLEVDGLQPGAQLRKNGPGPHQVRARVRVRCEVTPVAHLDLIVNGRIVQSRVLPRDQAQGRWFELDHLLDLTASSWIAARAYSNSPGGLPDAEAHTNPVFVYLDDRAPFAKPSVDAWIGRIDAQIATHAKRIFPDSAKVLSYFQQARDVLLKIRADGGLHADAEPAKLAATADLVVPGLGKSTGDAGEDQEMKAFLKPVPPKSPVEALASFEAVAGFNMELVAAETLVRSPVAGAFDENGNLYVAEMTDYPYNPTGPVNVAWQRPYSPEGRPSGSVRLLRDNNGDGVFDESHVFADQLLWATGIAPWKGGVYVCAGPDIWYLKDTNGDGKADLRQKVFTGFGIANQQAMVNSLLWSLDNRIYGSTAGNGGAIRPGNAPEGPAIIVKGRDFSFAPESHAFALETGTRQFGMSFDDWGNRFLCTQSAPSFHVVLPQRYLDRNPHFSAPASIFTTTPSPTPLFRISPAERWRHVRSSRRFAGVERPADMSPTFSTGQGSQQTNSQRAATSAGVSHHVVDATAGITIYRGGAYPKEYYGNLFVGDSVANVVHRRVLVPHGATFRSERADANTEFVRTSDLWFRPVNFINAPDGTLYCIDMAREYSDTINIPPDVEKHLDLSSGRDRGRIYRMAPPGFTSPAPPRLGAASTAELVRSLESPHGWWRDTAHRLLFERQDKTAIAVLEQLITQSASPQARAHALWSLQGLGSLSERIILAGLRDAHAGVRENALRLAESRLASQEIRQAIVGLISDAEPRVRLQVAFTLGESRAWDQPTLLARMVRENLADSWIQSAVLSSSTDCGGALFAAVTAGPVTEAKAVEFLRQLAVVVGFQHHPAEVQRVLGTLVGLGEQALPLLAALGQGLKRAGTTLAAADPAGRTRPLLERAAAITADSKQPEVSRRAAIEALGFVSYEQAAPPLLEVLSATSRPSLHQAALGVLAQFAEPQVGSALVERYRNLEPAARTRLLDVLLERPERIAALFTALGNKTIAPADLSAKQVAFLRQHGDALIRERTTDLFGAANPAARQEVFRSFLPALDLPGDAARGKAIFESRCALCHRRNGVGFDFGPDLSSLQAGGKEKLLSSILDPNREVAPQFFVLNLETKDGESTGGILKNETASAITLLQVGGIERTLARDQIAKIKTQRQSLMPEGLETGLSSQDMANLIAFLFSP